MTWNHNDRCQKWAAHWPWLAHRPFAFGEWCSQKFELRFTNEKVTHTSHFWVAFLKKQDLATFPRGNSWSLGATLCIEACLCQVALIPWFLLIAAHMGKHLLPVVTAFSLAMCIFIVGEQKMDRKDLWHFLSPHTLYLCIQPRCCRQLRWWSFHQGPVED